MTPGPGSAANGSRGWIRAIAAAAPGDGGRLLTIRTDLPGVVLLPEQASMRDAVSQPFELVVDCIASAAMPPLRAFIGERMTVGLRQADGGYAPWHGHVLQAERLDGHDGLDRCRLTIGPWLRWLGLRQDSYVFQDRTALQIVEGVFSDYPDARWRLQVGRDALAAIRERALCVQHRESDLDFVARLLAEEGLHFWFEHHDDDGDGAPGEPSASRARHVMVIADAGAERDDLGPIRFASPHRDAYERAPEDTIDSFAAERRLAANAVTVGSWDHAKLAGASAAVRSGIDPERLPILERYEGGGSCRFPDAEAADRAARFALCAAELRAARFVGTGAARRLRPGAAFALTDHAGHEPGNGAFAVLAVRHDASNDLGGSAAALPGRSGAGAGSYRNRFECVPRGTPVVLPRLAAPPAPASLGGRVVGVEGAVAQSDRDHRVQVRLHFQDGREPRGNGACDPAVAERADEATAGIWMRVAGPAAGAGWGAVYTPRIGSEVAVRFLDGDIDRPLVTGALHAGTDAMPLSAGIGSGANHPGVISGLHSRRFDGEGFGQLALDDSPGQLRARLHASHADAELGLGHLVRQAGGSSFRGAGRGAGFEAGTAAWASVRAAAGLLVSATARAGTYGSARSTQMDAAEGVARLQEAREAARGLARAARAAWAQGLPTHDDGEAVDRFIRAIDPAQDGRHQGRVGGQDATLPVDGGRTAGDAPAPAFARPVALFDTPAALLAASDASVSAFAGEAISLVAHGDLQQTAAGAVSQASGRGASLYAHQGGIRAVAAEGTVSLQAHADALRILADASITIASIDDEIRIDARTRIELVAGRSSIVLEGGDIVIRTPGAFTVHGSVHAFEGPERGSARLPDLPAAPDPTDG